MLIQRIYIEKIISPRREGYENITYFKPLGQEHNVQLAFSRHEFVMNLA